MSGNINKMQKQVEKLAGLIRETQETMFLGKEVLGFKLLHTMTTVSGKKYRYWKAYRVIDGKQHVVFIGKDPEKSLEKIKKYCRKNQIPYKQKDTSQ
jgi:hypothetical protein